MKKLYGSNDACPYCGRPMTRPTTERLLAPFCQKCLPERVAKADHGRPLVNNFNVGKLNSQQYF